MATTRVSLGYTIGYRTDGIDGYTVHYFDLPMFSREDYANPKLAAETTLRKLQKDFPNAEWRMIESVEWIPVNERSQA